MRLRLAAHAWTEAAAANLSLLSRVSLLGLSYGWSLEKVRGLFPSRGATTSLALP